MSARHDDPLREYIARADFLLKQLHSPDSEQARTAAMRFAAVPRFAFRSGMPLAPDDVRRKDALDVIAVEEGAADWRDFRGRMASPASGMATIGDVLHRRGLTLDSILDGSFLPASAVTLLSGPSPHGKSGLALQIACNVAARGKGAVLFFTQEMGGDELLQRLLTTEARVDAHDVRAAGINAIEGARERLAAAANRLEKLPIYVASEVRVMTHVSAECRDIAEDAGGLSLVVLDYISLFSAGRVGEDSDPHELTKAVVALAKEFRVAVIVIAPLQARSLEEENPRPTMTELGSWRVLADAAAAVVLIHRPNVHERRGGSQNDAGPIQMQVEKHPQGPTEVTGTIIPRIRLITPEIFSEERDYEADILPVKSRTL